MSANFVLPATFRAVGVAKRFFLRLTTAFFIVLRCHCVGRGSSPYHHLPATSVLRRG